MVEKRRLSKSSSDTRTSLGDIKGQTQEVICRLFFVRHGKSQSEIEHPSAPQDSQTPLSLAGKEQIEKVGQELRLLGLDNKNTLMLYAGGTKRVIESKEILEKYNIGAAYENPLLETTQKKHSHRTNKIEGVKSHWRGIADQLKNITEFIEGEILKSFQEKGKYAEKKNLILLGHKSSEAFPQLSKERGEDITLRGLRIKPGETFEADINASYKLINYEKHREILHITTKNYKEISEILSLEQVAKTYFDQLFKKEIQLFELQNLINYHFQNHLELYEKYLGSECQDLRNFCLANLLKLNRYKEIEKTYLDPNHNFPLSQEEKKIFFSNIEQSEVKTFIAKLFILKKDLREEEESELFKSYKILDLYENIKERRKTYDKVIEIQGRSIDGDIKVQKPGAILGRKMYRMGRKGEGSGGEAQKVSIDIQEIIGGLKSGKKYVLPAHVGNGKSIWSSEIMKKLTLDPNVYIEYFEGKDFNNPNNKPKLIYKGLNYKTGMVKFFNYQKGVGYITPDDGGRDIGIHINLPKEGTLIAEGDYVEFESAEFFVNRKKVSEAIKGNGLDKDISRNKGPQKGYKEGIHIICIDAIDEINDPTLRQEMKDKVKKLDSGVLLTSRLSEYNDQENYGLTTIGMENISKEVFIRNKISEENKAQEILKKLEQSNLSEEIGGNPLLLNFICILSKEEQNESKGKEYSMLGIKKLSEITNKSSLYENIIRLILYKHQNSKGDFFIKNEITKSMDEYMDVLGELAYNKFVGNNIVKNKSYLSNINILFKIDKDANYDFIHKSFEEFFLARYLTQQPEGDQVIYEVRDLVAGIENRNIWKEFRPVVDFYGEILINQNQKETSKRFLGEEGLLKNDDAYGYNFTLGLQIVSKLSEDINMGRTIAMYSKRIRDMEMYDFLNTSDVMYTLLKSSEKNNAIKAAIMHKMHSLGELLEHNKDLITRVMSYVHINFLLGDDKIKKVIYDIMHKKKNINDVFFCKILSRSHHKESLECVKERIDKCKDEVKHGMLYLNGIYKNLANSEDGDILEYLKNTVDVYLSKGNYYHAGMSLDSLAVSKDSIEYVKDKNLSLLVKGEFAWIGNIYKQLAEHGDKEFIEYMKKLAEDFHEKGQHGNAWKILMYMDNSIEHKDTQIIEYIEAFRCKLGPERESPISWRTYADIAKNVDRKILKHVKEAMERTFENGNFYQVATICLELKTHKDPLAMEYVKEFADRLLKQGRYSEAFNIYLELAKDNNKETIQYVMRGTEVLLIDGKYGNVWEIYCQLATKKDREIIEFVKKGINILLQEGEYGEVRKIYEALAEDDDRETIEYVKKGANELLNKTQDGHSFIHTYKKLAERGENGAIEHLKRIIDKRFETGIKIYEAIVKTKDKKIFKSDVLKTAEDWEIGLFGIDAPIYEALLKSGHRDAIEYVKEKIDVLFKAGAYSCDHILSTRLTQKVDKSDIEYIREKMDILVDKKQFGLMRNMYPELIEKYKGNKEGLKKTKEKLQSLLRAGFFFSVHLKHAMYW